MQNRVRLGILALPSSGTVGIVSVLPPGVFINPAVDPAGFAQASGMVGLGNMIGMVSLVLLLVGVQSLYSILVEGSAGRGICRNDPDNRWGRTFPAVCWNLCFRG